MLPHLGHRFSIKSTALFIWSCLIGTTTKRASSTAKKKKVSPRILTVFPAPR
jgi:hypothetical protein